MFHAGRGKRNRGLWPDSRANPEEEVRRPVALAPSCPPPRLLEVPFWRQRPSAPELPPLQQAQRVAFYSEMESRHHPTSLPA